MNDECQHHKQVSSTLVAQQVPVRVSAPQRDAQRHNCWAIFRDDSNEASTRAAQNDTHRQASVPSAVVRNWCWGPRHQDLIWNPRVG
jgi:hypothetical protein